MSQQVVRVQLRQNRSRSTLSSQKGSGGSRSKDGVPQKKRSASRRQAEKENEHLLNRLPKKKGPSLKRASSSQKSIEPVPSKKETPKTLSPPSDQLKDASDESFVSSNWSQREGWNNLIDDSEASQTVTGKSHLLSISNEYKDNSVKKLARLKILSASNSQEKSIQIYDDEPILVATISQTIPHTSDSDSTLNQDLAFDFQGGSFAKLPSQDSDRKAPPKRKDSDMATDLASNRKKWKPLATERSESKKTLKTMHRKAVAHAVRDRKRSKSPHSTLSSQSGKGRRPPTQRCKSKTKLQDNIPNSPPSYVSLSGTVITQVSASNASSIEKTILPRLNLLSTKERQIKKPKLQLLSTDKPESILLSEPQLRSEKNVCVQNDTILIEEADKDPQELQQNETMAYFEKIERFQKVIKFEESSNRKSNRPSGTSTSFPSHRSALSVSGKSNPVVTTSLKESLPTLLSIESNSFHLNLPQFDFVSLNDKSQSEDELIPSRDRDTSKDQDSLDTQILSKKEVSKQRAGFFQHKTREETTAASKKVLSENEPSNSTGNQIQEFFLNQTEYDSVPIVPEISEAKRKALSIAILGWNAYSLFAQKNRIKLFKLWRVQYRLQREKHHLASMFWASRMVNTILAHWRHQVVVGKQLRANSIQVKFLAEQNHNFRLCNKVIKTLSSNVQKAKFQEKQKLFSIIVAKQEKRCRILAKAHTIRVLKEFVNEARTREFSRLKFLSKCLVSWQRYVDSRRWRSNLKRDVRTMFQTNTKQQVFARFIKNMDSQKQNRLLKQKAKLFKRDHLDYVYKGRVIESFQKLGLTKKTQRQALVYGHAKLKQACMDVLKRNVVAQFKKQQQQKLVSTFYKCNIATKALQALGDNIQLQKDFQLEFTQKFLQRKKSLLFKLFSQTCQSNKILKPLSSVPLMKCAQTWLEYSFLQFMSKIWFEFPNQRINIDSNGESLLLPNYLNVSRRRRYRKFFFTANAALRKACKARVFDWLLLHTMQRKQAKKGYGQRRLQKLFEAFRSQTWRQRLLSTYVSKRGVKRSLRTKHNVFKELVAFAKSQKRLNRASYKVSLKVRKRVLSQKVDLWHSIFRKKVCLTRCFRKVNKKYTSQVISKMMCTWVSLLRLNQRKLLLKKRQYAFENQKVPLKYYIRWRGLFLKRKAFLLETAVKQQKLEESLTKKAFKALKVNLYRELSKKIQNQAAEQEHIHWLGKRALNAFKTNVRKSRLRSFVKQYSADKQRLRLKKRILSILLTYGQFKQDQTLNDTMVTAKIRQIGQKRIFNKWRKATMCRFGLNLLDTSMQLTQIRMAFQRVWKFSCVQEQKINYLKHFFLQRKAFFSLNNFRKRQVELREKVCLLQTQRKAQYFEKWRFLLSEVFAKDTKCWEFLVEKKSQLVWNCLKQWKKQTDETRTQRVVEVYNRVRYNRRSFTGLKGYWQRRKALQIQYQFVQQRTTQERTIKTLLLWRQAFWKRRTLVACFEAQRANKRAKVFYRMYNLFTQKSQSRELLSEATKEFNFYKMKQTFAKLRLATLEHREVREALQAAEVYVNARKIRLIMHKWITLHLKNKFLAQASLGRKMRRQSLKRNFFKIWTSKSSRTLLKVKGCKIMTTLMARYIKKRAIQDWKRGQEAHHVELLLMNKAARHHDSQILRQAYQLLVQNKLLCQFKRVRNEEIAKFQQDKSKVSTIRHLLANLRHQKTKRKGETFYRTTLAQKVLTSLRIQMEQREISMEQTCQFEAFQRQLILSSFLSKWVEATQHKQWLNQAEKQSDAFRTYKLKVRSMQALSDEVKSLKSQRSEASSQLSTQKSEATIMNSIESICSERKHQKLSAREDAIRALEGMSESFKRKLMTLK